MRAGFWIAAMLVSAPALGDEAKSHDPEVWVKSPVDRPHTIAEVEGGILVLPDAPISAGQSGGSTPIGSIGHGDATVLTGIHIMYRGSPTWAVGAGFLFAPRPTSDSAVASNGLVRLHSRSYLVVGAEGRYVPTRWRLVEPWVGASVGGVVIADRFETDLATKDRVPTILGTPQVTVRTEGFSAGVQAGLVYFFADTWTVGILGRADKWLLPTSPACSSLGDCATVRGAVDALQLGLTLGYRIPL